MANGQIVLMILNQLTTSLLLYAEGCKTVHPTLGYALLSHLHLRQTRKRFESCVFACQSTVNCLSINYNTLSWQCDLNNATAKQFPNDFVSREYHIYSEDILKEAPYCRKLRCVNGGTCFAHSTPPREICICKYGFSGSSCEACDGRALGMESGGIKNNQITASSDYGGKEAWRARLNSLSECWTAATSNANQYLQISFDPESKLFTKIATQGSAISACWVKKYSLKFQRDSTRTWEDYKEKKFFQGNSDQNTVVNNTLSAPVRGKVLRICTLDWFSCVAMRVELYGCPV